MSQPAILKKYYHSLSSLDSIFENRILTFAKNGAKVLDAGSGDGSFGILSKLKSEGLKIIGLDLSIDDLEKNPWLDERIEGSVENLPFENESFDIIICRSVFEHLEKPHLALSEFSRALRSGGRIYISTFNLYHPQNFISANLPLSVRERLKSKLIEPDVVEGTYPTYYRCNTKNAFSKLANKAGLKEISFGRYGTLPDYWSSKLVSSFFLAYERLTDISFLRMFKPHIIAIYTKA